MDPKNTILFLLLILSAQFVVLSAQTIHIKGRVTDAETGEGLPFCNIVVEGANSGTAADEDGNYELTFTQGPTQLKASYLGYVELSKSINTEQNQIINFALQPASQNLGEVVVYAGENPAHPIVRSIIANKDKNHVEAFETFQCEQYQKMEIDLTNIPEKWKERKLFKPFSFVFENFDSTSDEKPFLPLYLNEAVADIYHSKDAGKPKTVIRSQQTSSGTGNKSIIEFIKSLYSEFSVYDNFIYIMDRPFASPFANSGFFYYEYYLLDSALIDGQKCYQIKFKPKRKQETTFFGDFWVADNSFAVARVNMRMSEDANINFLSRAILFHEFTFSQNHWLPAKEKLIIDFQALENTPSGIGRRSATYRNFVLNDPNIQLSYQKADPNYIVSEVDNQDEDFWLETRHEPLSANEASVYAMIDSIQNLKAYKTYTEILQTLMTGSLELGPIQVGSYLSAYSTNRLEGNRFRIGVGTTDEWSTKIRANAFLAYGTRDKSFKYGGDVKVNLKKQPRIFAGASYLNDVSLSSGNSEEFLQSDLFSGFRRNIFQKLIRVEESKVFVEKFRENGWYNRLTLLHRDMDPYGKMLTEGRGFNFGYLPDPENTSRVDTVIRTTELVLKTRFAKGELLLESDFDRFSFGTKQPIVELTYTYGIDNLGGDYEYHKLAFNYKHYAYFNPLGWFSYQVKAGKTFGTLPFLLLEVHPGNESYFLDETTFNTMNRYEFVSDTYLMAFLEHHFEGFFLNRIPLLRKLKFREYVTLKGVFGSMSEKNRLANRLNAFFPSEEYTYTGFRTPSQKPYLEASVGVENILKVLKIEALWRINYNDNPQATRFAFRAGFGFYF